MYPINATCIHFSRHGTVTGASHPRGRLTGLAQHAGETAVAPLVVQGPQVRAALIEGMRPSAAVCRAAASGTGGVACLGLVTAGHKYVLLLSRTLCAASAAACLRLLRVDDLIGRAASLTSVSDVACSVLGQVWSAEPARAGRAQHFLEQPLRERWYRAAERSGR